MVASRLEHELDILQAEGKPESGRREAPLGNGAPVELVGGAGECRLPDDVVQIRARDALFLREGEGFGERFHHRFEEEVRRELHHVGCFGPLTEVEDALAERPQHWLRALLRRRGAGEHDPELARGDGLWAAQDRRTQIRALMLFVEGGKAGSGGGREGARRQVQAARAQAVQEAMLAQRDLLKGGVIGEAGDDNAARLDGAARLVDHLRAPACEGLRFAPRAVVGAQGVARVEQALGHRCAHIAQTDKCNRLAHDSPLKYAERAACRSFQLCDAARRSCRFVGLWGPRAAGFSGAEPPRPHQQCRWKCLPERPAGSHVSCGFCAHCACQGRRES